MAYNIPILNIFALFSGFGAFGKRGLSTLSTSHNTVPVLYIGTSILSSLKTAVVHLHIVRRTVSFLIDDCKLSLISAMLFIPFIISSIVYDKPHITGPNQTFSHLVIS